MKASRQKRIRRQILQVLAAWLVAAQAVAAPVDVYILTGQSNSLGTTASETDLTPGAYAGDSAIQFYWYNVSGSSGYPPALIGNSFNLFKPLQIQQGGYGSPYFWGPEFGFARTLYEAGRTNIAIIKASNSGSGNTQWDKTVFDTNHNAAPMWGHVSNTVNLALGKLIASNKTFKVRGLLYLQGEANTTFEANNAGPRFGQFYSNLIASINASYPGTATGMRAVLAEIGASQVSADTRTTTTQQMALASANASIAFVGTRDLPLKDDGLHFPKYSKLEIGRRMANCFLGRPTIVSVGLDAVTNASDGQYVIFERYVPDTNGLADGVNLEGPNPFTGFADGAGGGARAGVLVSGSAGNVVFADYSDTNATSDIACGNYNFVTNGLPADWSDSGTAVTFAFADPYEPGSNALVSAAAFELGPSAAGKGVTVSLLDAHGDALYTSGAITSGRYGFEAREAFSGTVTSAVARVVLQGATNVLWTIGHVTDGGVPDFAWSGWRLPSAYERWSARIPDPALREDAGDPDGDGAMNLWEYASGTSPTNNLSCARVAGIVTNGGFAIQFPRALLDDIVWVVERSSQVSTNSGWETIATKQGSEPWTGPAAVEEADSGAGKLVLVREPDSPAGQRYLRVRVSH